MFAIKARCLPLLHSCATLRGNLPQHITRPTCSSTWVTTAYKMTTHRPPIFLQQVRHLTTPLERKTGEFWGRDRDIQRLTALLRGIPQISLVEGQSDVGKSWLVSHILQREIINDRKVLVLNLRELNFASAGELTSSIQKKNSIRTMMSDQFKLSLSLMTPFGLDAKAQASKDVADLTSLEKVNKLLEEVQKQLPAKSFWTGGNSPILFIDEAHELRNLELTCEGLELLGALFRWFISCTKEKRCLHVVLATSDSLLPQWLTEKIGPTTFEHYVVCNLSKTQAKEFWDEKIISYLGRESRNNALLFERAHEVCGGNMRALECYISQYIMRDGDLFSEHFSHVNNTKLMLDEALIANKHAWTSEQLIVMLETIVEAPEKFVTYEALCSKLGKNIVDAFIRAKILHLRPPANNYPDLDPRILPLGKKLVIPETPSMGFAMKAFLLGRH